MSRSFVLWSRSSVVSIGCVVVVAGLVALVTLLPGCALLEQLDDLDDDDGAEGEGEGEGEGDGGQVVEDVLFDVLECQELARPSTLARLRDVLDDPTAPEVRALLLNPTDLATVVAEGGVQVELSVIVLQNLHRIATEPNGALAHIVEGGFGAAPDGFSCDAPVTASCTAGTSTTTLSCDGSSEVQSVHVAFADCVLDGTLHQGALTVARDDADAARAVVTFEGLTFDEVERLDGGLSAVIATGAPARLEADADADSGFVIVSHGGLSSQVSCGEETRVSLAHLAVDDEDAVFQLDALKVGKDADDRWAMKTFGDHLRFSDLAAFSSCRCPDAGSGLEIDVPRPLLVDGAPAKARVSWAAPSGDLCRDVDVELVGWPTECGALALPDPDCAAGATRDALAALFGALCVP